MFPVKGPSRPRLARHWAAIIIVIMIDIIITTIVIYIIMAGFCVAIWEGAYTRWDPEEKGCKMVK